MQIRKKYNKIVGSEKWLFRDKPCWVILPAADAWWENTDYKSDGTWICPGQFVLAATIEYFEDEDVNLFKKETALSTLALLFF